MRSRGIEHPFIVLLCLPAFLWGGNPGMPDSWVPARWAGGPLELEWRVKAKTAPSEPAIRDAIAGWYDPATLRLLEGSGINCLLVTWSAGADRGLERRQQQLVKAYAAEAHRLGISVLGLVYPGADPSEFVAAAADARLEGFVLDGEFPAGFTERVTQALASAATSALVIPIAAKAASIRTARLPVLAVKGVSPSARNLSDMGIRAAPSSEPWIQSNVWLVRSFRLAAAWRPVWISYQPDGGTPADYARSVADSAVAGGRWIAAIDDGLRAKLHRNDSAALAVWRRIGACLKFAEDHAEWRSFVPYGNLGVIVDTAAGDDGMADEYLKLVARRQVPYRPIARSQLSSALLGGFRAVLATALAPPSAAERKMLAGFAQNGGLLVAGPSWGSPPKDEPFAEVPLGKGRVTVYKDPDPESVARDMRDLLSHREAGVAAFNVPSVITYASSSVDGKRLLVQLLNYSNSPSTAITIRVSGNFRTARLFTPDAAPANLAMSPAEGQIDITIPKLSLWGGVLLE
jgi:hypothetical protein